MINFIWPPGTRLPAGTGGSENYTVGQVRELLRRGISAQIITVGLGKKDGRTEFVDIPFVSLKSVSQISLLQGTIVFVNQVSPVVTKERAFTIMHVPPPAEELRAQITALLAPTTLIATSHYAAKLWAAYLAWDPSLVHVAYPFAEACFGTQLRPLVPNHTTRILFAGRLSVQKGIYIFLEMLEMRGIARNQSLVFSVTTAGSDKPEGKVIKLLIDAHPHLTVVAKKRTPAAMAKLLAVHDIVLMPSNSNYWHETFGMVSVEAQHTGVRVVASDDGGLPETNCGGLQVVDPGNPVALAAGIVDAINLGPMSPALRHSAANLFTVEQSVDNLLQVLYPQEILVIKPIKKLVLRS